MRSAGWAAALVLAATVAAAQSPEAADPSLNPASTLRRSDLTGFRERPLFTPSRRRPPDPVDVAPAPAAAPPARRQAPNVRLAGVMESDLDAVAILQQPGGPRLSVRVGDRVEGWLVTAVEPQKITLRDGDRQQDYRLFAPGSFPAPSPAIRPQAGPVAPR